MKFNCEGSVYCEGCPLLELMSDDFTNQDRTDAANSVIILGGQFSETRSTRFHEVEVIRLEQLAREYIGYRDTDVSKVAVRALERRVTGQCSEY